jgi:predicted metal-binding protein
VPPLEMVDDIMSISKCGTASTTLTATINTFMSLKNLELNSTKCAKIHVGKRCNDCPELDVQGENMKSSNKEKYLGDYVNTSGNSKDTLAARVSRGYAVLSEMRVLLSDIPLGRKRVEIGISLREAWFINGCLFNSEAWCNYTKADIYKLDVIDHMILKLILGAQDKVPVEYLYLETATLDITNIISVRRMGYLQAILKRPDGDLMKRIYMAMKDKPYNGDWYKLIESDFTRINMEIN